MFILAIKEKPEESEKTFYEVKVEKIGEHDTGKLSEMFRLLKTGYRKLFDKPLFYRYVVSDLCWK